jgi:predicted NBD/HSP70 family sugar kinase
MSDVACGIDFGGTNIRIGRVYTSTGELIAPPFERSLLDVTTNEELLDIIVKNLPEGRQMIGISAAGEIDEARLVNKFSANSHIKGEITFGKELKNMGHDVVITNDMRAGVQGEARYGQGKGKKNVLLGTYSTGYNCAVARDGKNVTEGEFGHMVLKPDSDLFCGCGYKGHLEIYISGNGAATMARQFFDMTHMTDHPILRLAIRDLNKKAKESGDAQYKISDLKSSQEVCDRVVKNIGAKHIFRAFLNYPRMEPQRSIRNTQVNAIASSFGMMNSAYNPLDIMIVMGSQVNDWPILFEPAMKIYNEGGLQLPSLHKPSVVKTALPYTGVQGAVAYFLSQMG